MAHTLRDPSASRVGHAHYMTFTVKGDAVHITIDDTVCDRTLFHKSGNSTFPVEDARAEYAKLLADGWKKHTHSADSSKNPA